MGLSQRKYARTRKERGLPGGSQEAVRKAIETGRIHTLADGSIDPATADREWEANTSDSLRRVVPAAAAAPIVAQAATAMLKTETVQVMPAAAVATATPAGAQAAMPSGLDVAATASADEKPTSDDKPTKADAERELAQVKAERAKLALQRDREEVVPRAEVDKAAAEFITTVKDRLLLIPDVIADQVAGLKDPIACRNVMEHEIRLALEELTRMRVELAA